MAGHTSSALGVVGPLAWPIQAFADLGRRETTLYIRRPPPVLIQGTAPFSRRWGFPQQGVKLPRLFLSAMSQIDPMLRSVYPIR
jgi:hypothetical protein